MERGGVMEYIGESSAIYYWRALGLIVSVLILYVVFEMQKKKMSRLSSANTHSSIVLLHKRHAGNPNYSSSTEICRIDGLRAELSFTVSACRRSICRRGSIISR